jgi:LacI family transcriptional regulator
MPDRVTLKQVAEEAGVSVMTVSNVVNGKPGASEATRQRIRQVIEQLGYVPNAAARGLRSGSTGLIGVMTLDLTMAYALEIVRGIADELASAELEVLISATYHDGTREHARVDFLTQGIVDGLILVAPVLEDQTVGLLQSRECPVVVVDPRHLDLALPRVTVDNYGGMRSAAQHLIDLGHRDIAYIAGDSALDSSGARYSGFVDAMKLAGLKVADKLVAESDFFYESGFRTALELIAKHHPTAIIAGADVIAMGALDAARAQGLTVPDEISVVGFDDLPQAANSFPGLTTVRQPLHDMGQLAARALVGQLDGSPPLMQLMQLPTTLVVRGTTAQAPPDQVER